MGLEKMELKDLPALTDQGCNRLYAEVAGVEYKAPAWHAQSPPVNGGILKWSIESPFVCRPDCPADIIEGLPGLVEKWTGKPVSYVITGCPGSWSVYISAQIIPTTVEQLEAESGNWSRLSEAANTRSEHCRHLAHACILAALAACIVYGRAKEGDVDA